MPSTPTTRLRIEKQGLGENINTWGDTRLNVAFDLVDMAIAGLATIALTGSNVTLTSVNYADDQSRRAVLVFTGTLTANVAITVPSVEKTYLVVNNTTMGGFTITIKTAAGTGYVLRDGPQHVYCNATDVFRATPRLDQAPLPTAAMDFNAQRLTNLGTPTANADAATKLYVDNTAFTMAAGSLPAQAGNAGKMLTTNGTVASWGPSGTPSTGDVPTSDGAGGLAWGDPRKIHARAMFLALI